MNEYSFSDNQLQQGEHMNESPERKLLLKEQLRQFKHLALNVWVETGHHDAAHLHRELKALLSSDQNDAGGTPSVLNGQVETPRASNLPPAPSTAGSETPRTDAYYGVIPNSIDKHVRGSLKDINFARQLERELSQARHETALKCAEICTTIYPRGSAHTYASENADRYRAQEDMGELLAMHLRAYADTLSQSSDGESK